MQDNREGMLSPVSSVVRHFSSNMVLDSPSEIAQAASPALVLNRIETPNQAPPASPSDSPIVMRTLQFPSSPCDAGPLRPQAILAKRHKSWRGAISPMGKAPSNKENEPSNPLSRRDMLIVPPTMNSSLHPIPSSSDCISDPIRCDSPIMPRKRGTLHLDPDQEVAQFSAMYNSSPMPLRYMASAPPAGPSCDEELIDTSGWECVQIGSLLPLVEAPQVHDLWSIAPSTLSDLLDGKYARDFDHVYVVDCRFDYEYEGGHIRTALNLSQPQDVEGFFMHPTCPTGDRVAVVFHCEFSSKRGPKLARYLRELDRAMHKHCYPQLSFSQVFLLDLGYKQFFAECAHVCEPREYVPMRIEDQRECMKKRISQHRRSWRSRSMGDLMQVRSAPAGTADD
eukprot:TRINITY_DN5166_c0_g1_i1.p1 TRINITY_DN5166_c0_g1~~TRINITY_DN5166_c0_g1_i1.p1  ORF type:complete len:395 (-),score=49.67 TRINITY_DN5166_c0_g1_i1:64-1248(-)